MKENSKLKLIKGYLHLIRREIINCRSQRQAKQAVKDAKRYLGDFNSPQLMRYGEKQLNSYLVEAGYID